MAGRTIGFRPANHQKEFLSCLPDRSDFIRRAIDSYLAQNEDEDIRKRMVAVENHFENLDKKLDLILNLLSSSQLPTPIETRNEEITPIDTKRFEIDPVVEKKEDTPVAESEKTMFYFADSLGAFTD